MHITLLTYGNPSRLNRHGKLARLLHADGHRLTLISSAAVAARVPAGCDFVLLAREHALRHSADFLRMEQMGALGRMAERRAWIAHGRRWRQHWLADDELRATLETLRPDVVWIEEELTPYFIVALGLRLPIVAISSLFDLSQGTDRPPINAPRVPRQTAAGRLRTALGWRAFRLSETLKRHINNVLYAGTDARAIWPALARRSGVDLRRHARRGQSIPLLFDRLPWLRLTTAELELPPVREPAEYIGPFVDLARRDAAVDPAYAATIARIAAVRGDRPLIYCAMGTLYSDADYVQRVIAAVGARPAWLLLLAAGDLPQPPQPPNVFALAGVPQLEVLAQADVMLTHGGAGSLHEALTFGVPLICYSTGHVDHNGNAARIAFHQVGVRGDIRRDSPAQIAQTIENVLTSPHYRRNARAMQQAYAQYSDDRARAALRRALEMANTAA